MSPKRLSSGLYGDRAVLPHKIKFQMYPGSYQRRDARPMWSVLKSDDAKLGKMLEGSRKARSKKQPSASSWRKCEVC
jgi:hypothetical protein